MAFVKVQQAANQGSAGSSPLSMSLPGASTTGNLLIAVIYANVASSNYSITGFTKDIATDADTPRGIAIFSKISAGETTISLVATGASVLRGWFFEFSGNAASSPFDVSGTATNTGTTQTSQTSGTTGTTAVANELAFTVIGWSAATAPVTVDVAFTATAAAGDRSDVAWKLSTGVVGTVAATWSATQFQHSTAVIATYKPSSVSATVAGVVADTATAAPAGTPSGTAATAGTVAATSTAAPVGTVTGGAAVAGVVADQTAAAPTGTPTGTAAVAGVAAGTTLAASAGTPSGGATVTGQPSLVALAAPGGSTAAGADVGGTVADLALGASAGTTAGSATVTGASSLLDLIGPSGTVEGGASVLGEVSDLALDALAGSPAVGATVAAPTTGVLLRAWIGLAVGTDGRVLYITTSPPALDWEAGSPQTDWVAGRMVADWTAGEPG